MSFLHPAALNSISIFIGKNVCSLYAWQSSSPASKPIVNDDYEIISASYQIASPGRQPKPPRPPPITNSLRQNGTLGQHTDVDGVPFVLNPNLKKQNFDVRTRIFLYPWNPLSILKYLFAFLQVLFYNFSTASTMANNLEYDFQLERQILCTTKTPNSKNPFFSQLNN